MLSKSVGSCHWIILFLVLATSGRSEGFDEYKRSLLALSNPVPKSSVTPIISAFGAQNGHLFAAVSYSDYDLQTNRSNDNDGSLVLGMGFGDPNKNFGTEVAIGITSVSTAWWGDGKFADEGNLNFKFHKSVKSLAGDYASIAFGASNALGWGGTREMDTNTYVAYSEKAFWGDFKQLSLTYSIGAGSAVATGESDGAVFGGIGIGHSHYSGALGFIGGEGYLSGLWYPDFWPGVSISYTRAGLLDNNVASRGIVTIGYALSTKELF